jgi:predicted Fe-Mo cluster-binding NifX family protein
LKVAISSDGNQVSAHFGRCPEFTLVEVNKGKVSDRRTIANPGHQPGLIPQFLASQGVECIICGGMGMRATGFFDELGIQAIVGVSGSIEEVLKSLQNGTLRSGESLCRPGSGKGYGVEKTICDHPDDEHKD